MMQIWQQLSHGRSTSLIKLLAEPPTAADGATPDTSQALLDAYVGGKRPLPGATPSQTSLRAGARLMVCADALPTPLQRNRVTARVQASMLQRCPEAMQQASLMLTNCNALVLAAHMLAGDPGELWLDERRKHLCGLFEDRHRALYYTLQWAQKMSLDAMRECNAFFVSSVGQRWVNALKIALSANTQTRPIAPTPNGSDSGRLLRRLLEPLSQVHPIPPNAVSQIQAVLDAEELEVIRAFQVRGAGQAWMLALAQTLTQLRTYISAAAVAADISYARTQRDDLRFSRHLDELVADYTGAAEAHEQLKDASRRIMEGRKERPT